MEADTTRVVEGKTLLWFRYRHADFEKLWMEGVSSGVTISFLKPSQTMRIDCLIVIFFVPLENIDSIVFKKVKVAGICI